MKQPSKIKHNIPSEHEEQAAVVKWFDETYHDQGRIYAIPNGGNRSHAYTQHLHAEGMRKGAPDLVVALHGGQVLWIEMKRANKLLSRLSHEQNVEHDTLRALGHTVFVCYGAKQAIEDIAQYMHNVCWV